MFPAWLTLSIFLNLIQEFQSKQSDSSRGSWNKSSIHSPHRINEQRVRRWINNERVIDGKNPERLEETKAIYLRDRCALLKETAAACLKIFTRQIGTGEISSQIFDKPIIYNHVSQYKHIPLLNTTSHLLPPCLSKTRPAFSCTRIKNANSAFYSLHACSFIWPHVHGAVVYHRFSFREICERHVCANLFWSNATLSNKNMLRCYMGALTGILD